MAEDEKPRVMPPQFPQQGNGLDPTQVGDSVWGNLANRLSKDISLDDKDLARKYMRNRRRSSLMEYLETKIVYETNVRELMVFEKSKNKTDAAVAARANAIQSIKQRMESLKLELEAIVTIMIEEEYLDSFKEIEGYEELQKDNQSA